MPFAAVEHIDTDHARIRANRKIVTDECCNRYSIGNILTFADFDQV